MLGCELAAAVTMPQGARALAIADPTREAFSEIVNGTNGSEARADFNHALDALDLSRAHRRLVRGQRQSRGRSRNRYATNGGRTKYLSSCLRYGSRLVFLNHDLGRLNDRGYIVALFEFELLGAVLGDD
jgi:hypothetical protein